MTPDKYITWLSGFLDGKENLSAAEVDKIKTKLQECFVKVTGQHPVIVSDIPLEITHPVIVDDPWIEHKTFDTETLYC